VGAPVLPLRCVFLDLVSKTDEGFSQTYRSIKAMFDVGRKTDLRTTSSSRRSSEKSSVSVGEMRSTVSIFAHILLLAKASVCQTIS